MVDKEMLQAMQGIVSKSITDNNKKLHDIFATKQDLERFATKEDLAALAAKISEQTSEIRADLEKSERETRILIENSYQRIEKLLLEDYGRVATAAAKGGAVADEYRQTKGTVQMLERAVESHNKRITKLELSQS